MSGTPPARAATTGIPEDMASRTTRPSVSDSEGIKNTSPLAYAWDSSSPCSIPVNTAGIPENILSSSSLSESSQYVFYRILTTYFHLQLGDIAGKLARTTSSPTIPVNLAKIRSFIDWQIVHAHVPLRLILGFLFQEFIILKNGHFPPSTQLLG